LTAEEGTTPVTVPPATGERNWGAVIRTRLAGTVPRHAIEEWRVPGLSADASRAYRRYFPPQARPAAVLVPLIERPELSVLLTQRATDLRNHAGQISFPGGRIERGDAGEKEAALREAREEIGLDERFVNVVGYLPDHVVMTGFRVTPVVAFVRPGFELLLDLKEVTDTFEVPLAHVFDPANHQLRMRRSGFTGEEVEFCDIPYGEHIIWGATAGMLLTLYRLCVEGA
jgi:8-oxo-dGTP pyrophosphatase MutT (NUDIX family)